MNLKLQRKALRDHIRRTEYLLCEALASADVVIGAEAAGLYREVSVRLGISGEAVVAHRLLESAKDNLILRADSALELGNAKRSLAVIERLDRIGYPEKGRALRAFWNSARSQHADILKSVEIFRDKFIGHFDPVGTGDAALDLGLLAQLLSVYREALSDLREEVFREAPESLPISGLRAAAERVMGTVSSILVASPSTPRSQEVQVCVAYAPPAEDSVGSPSDD